MSKAPNHDRSGGFALVPPAGFEPATLALGVRPRHLLAWVASLWRGAVRTPGGHQGRFSLPTLPSETAVIRLVEGPRDG